MPDLQRTCDALFKQALQVLKPGGRFVVLGKRFLIVARKPRAA